MEQFNPDLLIYIGLAGILLGLIFFILFIFRRIQRLLRAFGKKKIARFGFFASLRNLILILAWTAVLGIVFFMGLFARAYYAFTYEKPVAEIITQSSKEAQTSLVTLIQLLPDDREITQNFIIKGDQWMLEGDILKWNNWLNFLGLHTRYRLTRLRGRYIQVENEKHQEKTIYSLVRKENHPLWRHLYQYGYKLPLVSTAYGNAVFQTAGKEKHFVIYISTSGFLVREIIGGEEKPIQDF